MKTTKLENLNACEGAIEWVKTRKSAKDAWINCERGDWMLWIAQKLNIDDRKLTLAKAKCVEPVRHLMKDQRSLDALDACYKYANAEISREELNSFASFASSAYAYATYAATAATASASAATDRNKSLKKSADICREILTDIVLLKYRKIK